MVAPLVENHCPELGDKKPLSEISRRESMGQIFE